MRYLFISFLILNAFVIFVSSASQESGYNKKLIDLEKQLDRIELQLNNSVNQILQKFDTNNQRILNSIKSFRYSQFNRLYFYFYFFEQEKQYSLSRAPWNSTSHCFINYRCSNRFHQWYSCTS